MMLLLEMAAVEALGMTRGLTLFCKEVQAFSCRPSSLFGRKFPFTAEKPRTWKVNRAVMLIMSD